MPTNVLDQSFSEHSAARLVELPKRPPEAIIGIRVRYHTNESIVWIQSLLGEVMVE